MATIRERPEIRFPFTSRYNAEGAHLFIDKPPGGQGFKYHVYKYLSPDNGNDTRCIIEKRSPQDAHIRTWEVVPRPGWKISTLAAFWTDAGMAVDLYIYDLNVSGSRPNDRESVIVPVGFNSGGLMEEAGGTTIFAPNEEEGGGGVTREEVEAVLRAELPRYFGPQVTNIVNNIRPKVHAELLDMRVVTEAMFDTLEQGGSTIVAQRIENEAFEGARNALRTEATEPVEPAEPTEGGTP